MTVKKVVEKACEMKSTQILCICDIFCLVLQKN